MLAVIARNDQTKCAVYSNSHEGILKGAANVGSGIVEHFGIPKATGVMQHRLVKQRKIGSSHDATRSRIACGSNLWIVVAQQIVCRRLSAHGHQLADVLLIAQGDAKRARLGR
jgi:hypothetical protein